MYFSDLTDLEYHNPDNFRGNLAEAGFRVAILTFSAVHSDIFRGSRLVILTNIAVDPDIFRGLKMTLFAVHGPSS